MKRLVLAVSCFISTLVAGNAQTNDFVSIASEPSCYAWWLRAQFRPFELEVRGVPVREIRATWCKATEFRKSLFPTGPSSDLEQNNASFSIDGFFDGSKVRQTALVGVYETCNGQRGSFLLVLKHSQGKSPIVRFVQEMPGVQFGMLRTLPNATIQVFHCMECDHATSFKWSKSKQRFVQTSSLED